MIGRRACTLLFFAASLAALASLDGCRRWRSHGAQLRREHAANDPNALHVAHVTAPITIDGELDEEPWRTVVVRSGPLVAANGAPGRPHSDARLFWAGDALYLGLYAADGDLRGSDATRIGDAFHVELSRGKDVYSIDVDISGVLKEQARHGGAVDASWRSGAKIGHEADGTIKPRAGGSAPKKENAEEGEDGDEEWVLELAVPLASIGAKPVKGESFGIVVRRCDVSATSDAPNAPVVENPCSTWGTAARPKALVLD
ncbi:MAG: hypothetical protein ACHREM_16575 [Polyangiales bacterium]